MEVGSLTATLEDKQHAGTGQDGRERRVVRAGQRRKREGEGRQACSASASGREI